MYFGRRRSFIENIENKAFSDINVTPLVDVVLVLLIIFMVTAPMLQMGIDVNLPHVRSNSIDVTEEKLVLTINNAKEIFLNKTPVSITDLRSKLQNIFANRIDRDLYLRADSSVAYGFVVEVMSEARKAGVDRLGMITEPPEEPR